MLSNAFELSSFGYFQRGSVREVALFVSREVLERSKLGERQSIKHKEYMCHVQVSPQRIAAAAITDGDYPPRVAFSLINQAFEMFTKAHGTDVTKWNTDVELRVDGLEEILLKFQEPEKSDNITKIHKDLDETKEVLVKSIDQLLARGEKLEVLAEKSNDLSYKSKAFLKQSEKLNSCCILI